MVVGPRAMILQTHPHPLINPAPLMKIFPLNLGSLLAFAMLATVCGQAHAATITGNYLGVLAGSTNGANDGIEFSLFDPANSYIKANPLVDIGVSAGTVNLNGILDYHFYSTGAASPSLSLAGGSRIADALSASVAIRTNRRNLAGFYTTTSPSGPYDVSQRGIDLSGSGTLGGTISLAGLDPNTPVDIYLMGVAWNAVIDVNITPYNGGIAGAKMLDVVVNPNEGGSGRSYLSHIQVSDFSDIDRIDFELEGNEAGLHGIIVTQIPEPSALLLSGLGFLLLLRRRRC